MRLKIRASMYYDCRLTEKDEEIVRKYLEEAELGISDAGDVIMQLQAEGKIDVFKDYQESEDSDASIDFVAKVEK